jgi:uncharacterized membrane protein YgaE (UPF0421/DUF939 family)
MDTEGNMIFDNQIVIAIIGVIGGVILGIPSMLAVMVSMNKMNSEKVKNLADGAESLANAGSKLREDMEKQVANLEKQMDSEKDYRIQLERLVAHQDNEIIILRRNDDMHSEEIKTMGRQLLRFQRWAERLTDQVVKAGLTPVRLEEIEMEAIPQRRITDELGK